MKRPSHAAQGFTAFRADSYFNALDGLRALAILMVLFLHVPKLGAGHAWHALQENGRYGVSFFFVISGFLICSLFLREEAKNGRIDLWKFYGRRTLRLLPLYYVALLLQVLLVFVVKQYTPENQELFREKLPSYIFYYSNWLPTATEGPFFCAWSLAVEEQFYLVFGLLLFCASKRVIIFATLAALAAKIVGTAFWGDLDAISPAHRVLFSYQEPILLGVLTAFALNHRSVYEFFARWLAPLWVTAAIGLGLAGWLGLHLIEGKSAWEAQLLYLVMTLMLVSVVVRPATPGLGHPFLAHIGKISYGIYLLHMFVISAVKKLPGMLNPFLCFLVATTVVILVASLVYRYFEYPIIQFYKKRLSPTRAHARTLPPTGPAVLTESPAGR